MNRTKTSRELVPSPSNDFSVALWAGSCHPDAGLRRRVLGRLDDWIEKGEPYFSDVEITRALDGVAGTPLEPFVLTDTRLSAAVRMVRVAFSRRMQQTRLRLVSEETLGNSGGLVLTDNLKGYYVERWAGGENIQVPKSGWFLAPAEMERGLEVVRGRRQGTCAKTRCEVDESGYLIKVPVDSPIPFLPSRASGGASGLEADGMILVPKTPFRALGLSIRYERPNLCIRLGSPESALRLSALMVRRATLVIDLVSGSGERGRRLYVGLEPLLRKDTCFPSVITLARTGSAFSGWISTGLKFGFSLPVEERLVIARWALPLEEWFTEDFFRRL